MKTLDMDTIMAWAMEYNGSGDEDLAEYTRSVL
jgi:hypothetical protein